MNRDLGDFQTPPALVAAILARLGPISPKFARVLEPTCGRGHFLEGLLSLDPPPAEIRGVELQAGHFELARDVASRAGTSTRVELIQANLFDLDLATGPAWSTPGPLLVVGNPPWVTSAELGALGSGNHPVKRNVKQARGLDALTGSANFDLAEAVWLKLLTELAGERPTVALLCKVAVARAVLEHAARLGWPVADAWLARVDARRWFGASVEACLFCLTLGPPGSGSPGLDRVPCFPTLDPSATPSSTLGFVRGRLVADLDAYDRFAFADALTPGPLVWRQGVKHDAAALMELFPPAEPGGPPLDGHGNAVPVEATHVYPLLKSTALARPGPGFVATRPSRFVIVTQSKVGDDTRGLADSAPGLWAYLRGNAAAFASRGSSVYRGAPEFAMFGVGPYSFAPYKVAVSALHRSPVFRALGPSGGRPVMLDDTAYFLPCRSPEQAALVAHLANDPASIGLLLALNFPGSKRTITKAALQRVDLAAVLGRDTRSAWVARAEADVERLAGRAPDWPDRLETLLEPYVGPEPVPGPERTDRRWPSPPSTTSAGR